MIHRETVQVAALLTASWMLLYACSRPDDESGAPRDPEYYAGGLNTTWESGPLAYRIPSPYLGAAALADHQSGDFLFHSAFEEQSGLGPLFIQSSCESCHRMNGRSHPPFDKGDNSTGFLLRLSLAGESEFGGPLGVPGFGTQLQTEGAGGNAAEGRFIVLFDNVPVTYPDGTVTTLRQPYYTFFDTYQELPADLLRSGRNAPALIGLGLLEAIPEEDILALEDPSDADEDYISGIANRVWNPETGLPGIGRFGWKAGTASLIQQTADAFHQDMGITSETLFPVEACIGQSNCAGTSGTPDVSLEAVRLTAFYLKTLAVPARRGLDRPEVQRGKQLFHSIGCAGCHVPEWKTGLSSLHVLSSQTIYPYTDLLIHDLGEGLGDGRPEYLASANDWRTQPLWGIGLAELVNPDGTYLHDGRARTLEEAILWHGGEALWSRNDFMALSAEDRDAVIAFLRSL